MNPLKIAIFASGEGTNAEALMDLASREPHLLEVLLLISDRQDALALEKARRRDIPAFFIPQGAEAGVLELLGKFRPEWAFLAGYMRIVKQPILDFFQDSERGYVRMLNIHPSLLPAFPGLKASEQAFHAGVREAGLTVHIVDDKLDNGPIVVQEKFLRQPVDTLEQFIARGRAIENNLYVKAVRIIAGGNFRPQAQPGKGESHG